MKTNLLLCLLAVSLLTSSLKAQTNAPSIQTGVSFQWADVQVTPKQPATIKSITVNGIVYLDYGIPTGYEMTQLGTTGNGANHIKLNGTNAETTSASATWNASALVAFQDLNLNHYFEAVGNGKNICDNYASEENTTAQRQTLTYGTGIIASSSGVIAITERSANNCYHIEFFGIPVGGGAEQSLGETFVNKTSTKWGFGGTGTSGNIGTPGAVNPPPAGSDYWLSDRVVENRGTIGIAIFYLDDIAPTGSIITRAQLTASTTDHGDGKLFILTLIDQDKDGLSDVDDLDDDNDGIKDTDESNGVDPSADHDTDGIPNYQDSDFCVLSSSGVCVNLDADSDGIPNHLDRDSDNDGITDVIESGGTDANNDGEADGNIGTTVTTIGIPASANTGATPANTDGNGDFDFLDIDSDNDGIPDNVEAQTTLGYIAPSTTINSNTGIPDNYGSGLLVVDTDLDGIYDYLDLDSDNDGTPDIEENGMANTATNLDVDNDGLDNAFETNGVFDTLWDVNEDIEDPSDLSTLPDTDGDLSLGGDLDYRDLIDVYITEALLDFDGVDDYLDAAPFIEDWNEGTVMGWVKIESNNTGNLANIYSIAGQESMRLYITKGRTPVFIVITQKQVTSSSNYPSNNIQVQPVPTDNIKMENDVWYHVAGVFDSSSETLKLYLNGKLLNTVSDSNLSSELITKNYNGSQHIYSKREFTIGRYPTNTSVAGFGHFNGDIDEVRVFNKALTTNQLQQIVYQEIKEENGNVKGAVIPKDVVDFSDSVSKGESIFWSNLQAYYPMTKILSTTTKDYSIYNRDVTLHNINTVQEQTAPMPYETLNNGAWTTENTWLHGDVWDIEDVANNKDWSIVDIKHNVNASHAVKNLGLFVANGNTLTINGDNQVQNSWYLGLNGVLDLQDDSQLIQTINSDLVTSSTGRVLRRQEGTGNAYWYNYWSSPVGAVGATNLSNNNAAVNNTNNTDFKLDLIKDNSGLNCLFTNGYTGNGTISTYWLYTFINGLTYWDWAQLGTSTPIKPGIGYTQKGTGISTDQQYIFEGKPNNGTILLDVVDKGGAGSEPTVTETTYLMGNPYPSALDVGKFIDDNEGVIDGVLQLWQQWSGTSHNLNEYNGGYAQLNKLGAIRAYQFVGITGANNGNQNGTKVPTKYLPVGQAFITEIVADGKVEFNNSQRVFIKEADANGSFNSGSIFLKNRNDKKASKEAVAKAETEDSNNNAVFKKMRLEMQSVSGPETHRELLLGFSDITSDAYDYGYDAENVDINNNDIHLNLDGKDMNIQAYGAVELDKVVPLNFKSSGDNSFEIKLSEIENFDDEEEIYLKDNLTGTYFDLTKNTAYRFSSFQGKFNNRFEIVFQSEQESLGVKELSQDQNFVYYLSGDRKLYAKKLSSSIKRLALVNMLGQSVLELENVSQSTLENGLDIPVLATGSYVAYFRSDDNQVFSKKLIIN
ncbi:hypothetical protein GCM10022291_16670 [Postechiella marina]|uniref:LamG-like jellyroll fold domain-containing protein n=1 Tax=Postechiella marina TaxID=943941 RepID=A0ABP8C8L8_9FLAO